MQPHDNPILTPGAALARTQPSTSHARQQPKQQQNPSAAIKKIVAGIGTRYPPTSKTDLDGHAARLALLCCDLADIPPELLERAVQRHVLIPGRGEHMPKASQLVEIAKAINAETKPRDGGGSGFPGPYTVEGYADWINSNFPRSHHAVIVRDKDGNRSVDLRLGPAPAPRPPSPPITDREICKWPGWLVALGVRNEIFTQDQVNRALSNNR